MIDSSLDYFHRLIYALKPGQVLDIDLIAINMLGRAPDGYTQVDWLIEGIVGAAYNFLWDTTPQHYLRVIRLDRELAPNEKGWVSPDRRHLYERGADRIYRHINPPAN